MLLLADNHQTAAADAPTPTRYTRQSSRRHRCANSMYVCMHAFSLLTVNAKRCELCWQLCHILRAHSYYDEIPVLLKVMSLNSMHVQTYMCTYITIHLQLTAKVKVALSSLHTYICNRKVSVTSHPIGNVCASAKNSSQQSQDLPINMKGDSFALLANLLACATSSSVSNRDFELMVVSFSVSFVCQKFAQWQ